MILPLVRLTMFIGECGQTSEHNSRPPSQTLTSGKMHLTTSKGLCGTNGSLLINSSSVLTVSYPPPHILMDSIRSPDKVLILLMDSWWTPDKVYGLLVNSLWTLDKIQIDSMASMWTSSGLHQECLRIL